MKKITSLLLAIIFTLSLIAPISAMAAESSPTITVQSVSGSPGSAVDVAVTIKSNPGILGATLSFTYDDELTLTSATAGDAFSALTMTKPGKFTSPCKFTWDGQSINKNEIKDGTILTLHFTINDNAEIGGEYNVQVAYEAGDVVNTKLEHITVNVVDGVITALDYLPGDLNGDGKVNPTDIILLRRHITGGYGQTINETAADVNNDGKKNPTDVILIRRYVAGGYNVTLLPSTPSNPSNPCPQGHTIVIDKAVAPTQSSMGLTEGKHCSVCNTVIVKQEVIPKLQENQYSITYRVNNNDDYLQSLSIENPNSSIYSSESGLVLQDLIVNGYNFKGWYTAQTGGTRVTEISPGETGNKTLYAQWEKVEYTIHFASDMVPVDDLTYKAGEERTLPKPALDKYTFVGWSDKDGNMWTSVPKGTTGNITLYANWASNRNKAEAVSKLEDPIICEDTENGLMLFTYEIGAIKNVPLFTTLKLQCANGIISTVSKTETSEISSTQATTIAQTISNATTNSSSWTLSNDWNKSTEVSQSYLDQTGKTREEAETVAKSESNTYNLTSSNGGSSSTASTDSGSFKLSGNKSHSNTDTTEKSVNVELSVKEKKYKELNGNINWGSDTGIDVGIPEVGNASKKFHNSFEIGGKIGSETETGATAGAEIKTTNTGTDGWSNSAELTGSSSNTSTSSSTWNTTSGYENSKTASRSNTVSNVVSKLISEQYGYGESYAEGGSNSQSQALASSNSKSDEYSSTLTYHTSKINSTTTTFSSTGNTIGDYRMVMAGTVHIFATVGYDVATKSYFVYTYNVLDDETEEYLDYSYDGTFNDYETSIVPFEIPYFVNEYVNNRIAKTDGLLLDPDTGIIEDYVPTGKAPDEIVVIPSYIAVDNNDGTFTSVKVKGIAQGLFKNNKNIVAVQLGKFIDKIPDSTFEGCSSLKYVISPGVTKIGNNAFSSCTSLNTFTIPTDITELGENAFDGAPEIKATPANVNIAQAISSSGADKITLDISSIPDEEAADMNFEIGNITSFELQGKDKEYRGLSIKSDAETTVINGITFTENTKIPMELSSSNVTFDRVTVDCSGYALVLKSDETNISLNRNINLMSTSENAVITKSVNLKNLNSSIVGKLNITGNMLVCGEVIGDRYLTFENGEVIYITEEEYENYLTAHKITFDANGGTVNTDSKTASLNMAIGELPVPSRDYYAFDGWYTAASGGEKVTEDTIMTSVTDMTLYAHWVQNGVSAWTLASKMPAGSEVVNKKYKYVLTSYTTSSSSSLSGWTKYDTKRTSWGSTKGPVYSNPSNGSRNVWSEKYVSSSNYKNVYRYYRIANSAHATWGSSVVGDYSNRYNYEFDSPLELKSGTSYSFKLWCSCGVQDGYHTVYSVNYRLGEAYPEKRWVSDNYSTRWYYQEPIYTYYYKKTENKESTSNPTGKTNVSNVQEYVQYRVK